MTTLLAMGNGDGSYWFLALIALAVLIWIGNANSKKAEAAASLQRNDDAQKYFHQCQRHALTMPLPPINVGVIAQRGEIFYKAYPGINQIVEHHQTEYRGRSQGVSVRVTRGVTLRSGTYGGHAVVHSEMVINDTGTLYLSSTRVLFVGAKHSISTPLSHVVSATDYLDALKIDRTNAASLWFHTSEQNISVIIRRIAEGLIDVPKGFVARDEQSA